jgi:hypothetical protein
VQADRFLYHPLARLRGIIPLEHDDLAGMFEAFVDRYNGVPNFGGFCYGRTPRDAYHGRPPSWL